MRQIPTEQDECELPFRWKIVPLLYAYVYQYLITKVGNQKSSQEISLRIILEVWHRHIYHLPRVYDLYIVKELEEYGLIEQLAQGRYLIMGDNIKYVIKRLNSGPCISKGEPPYLYLHVFRKMMNIFGKKNQYISGTQIMSIWRSYIPNIARIYDNQILKEMCNFGLIRQITTQTYIFLGATGLSKLKKLNDKLLW